MGQHDTAKPLEKPRKSAKGEKMGGVKGNDLPTDKKRRGGKNENHSNPMVLIQEQQGQRAFQHGSPKIEKKGEGRQWWDGRPTEFGS